MTEQDLCKRQGNLPQACALLTARYDEVQSVASGGNVVGYSLHELRH